MRAVIAVALILSGTMLVLAPALVGIVNQVIATMLMIERTDLMNITMYAGKMDDFYEFICWVLGGVMIAVGTTGGMGIRPFSPADRSAAATRGESQP